MLRRGLELIGRLLSEKLKAELLAQGHRASGKLIDSIKADIVVSGNEAVISISYEDYGKFLNNGRRAGAKRVPIDAILRWLAVRNIGAAIERKRIAFAIQRKIFEQGSPTRNSFAFSQNGRRKLFNEQVVADNFNTINEILERLLIEEFEIQFKAIN